MSKNIDQIYTANPITTNASTDLMYFGQSPYGAGNDAAMTYANFSAQFGAPYTPAALTEVNDTNVTLTLGGTPSTALLHAASITAGWTGTLSGTRGGTGVNNGASTITLGGSLTTSGAFAATFTMTNTTSVTFPTSGTLATTSQLSNAWVDQTSASVIMATNTGYTSDDGASLVTFTLPTTSTIGDFVEINGKGSGLWTIAQATGQQIHIGTSTTTSGATGSLSSVNQYDCVRLRCLTANTIWTVVSQQSSGLTVV
jgi:hypothetical protein